MKIISGLFKNVGLGFIVTLGGIFMLLNFFGGIVAFVWLLIIHQWQGVIGGIVLSFVMPFVYSILSLPTFLFAAGISWLNEKKRIILATILGFIVSLYFNILMVLWVLYVYSTFVFSCPKGAEIPSFLWGYSVMISPIGYMASKEDSDAHGTTLGVLLAVVTYFVLTLIPAHPGVRLLLSLVIAILFSLFAAFLAYVGMKTQVEYTGQEAMQEGIISVGKNKSKTTLRRYKKLTLIYAISFLLILVFGFTVRGFFPYIIESVGYRIIINLMLWYLVLMYFVLLVYLYKTWKILKVSGKTRVRPSLIVILAILGAPTFFIISLVIFIIALMRANEHLKEVVV